MTEQSAQARMYELTAARRALEEARAAISAQIEAILDEGRELLEMYPGLLFRRREP